MNVSGFRKEAGHVQRLFRQFLRMSGLVPKSCFELPIIRESNVPNFY